MKSGDSLPYPKALVKATVIKLGHTATFTNANGEKGSILNFSVPDGTEAMLVTLSDEAKMPTIKEGRTLQIRNFIE
uniref:Uncharacterized protein n=1 Tax=Magallana gigas TaxID=29159 RepID=K1PEY3_MAGGI